VRRTCKGEDKYQKTRRRKRGHEKSKIIVCSVGFRSKLAYDAQWFTGAAPPGHYPCSTGHVRCEAVSSRLGCESVSWMDLA
jgi:hypothetical protein